MHARADAVGLDHPGGVGDEQQDEQSQRQADAHRQRLGSLRRIAVFLVFDNVKQRGTKTDDDGQECDDGERFDEHGGVKK